MERIRRVLGSGRHLWVVMLFGLPLVTTLWRWTAVPCTHDGHLHYHRVAAMRHAWENGLIFTRWLPDLAFGYGYPFFVYREPVPLYSVLFPHLLGLPLPAASNLIYMFSILAAGWFMFLWVRDVFGARAGLVSAVAYMAAPYILIDALVRGNLPESLALPMFPFLLWAGRRWLLTGQAKTFLFSAFGLAFLSLTHNISLLLFTPTLLIYLSAIGWLHRQRWRLVCGRLALLFGLGLGITIFYTGGALLEMDQVTLQQSTVTRNNDFHFNFTSWAEILAPVSPEDPTLLNPPLPFRLGWIPVGLAILGMARLFIKKEIRDSQSPISNLQSPHHEQRGHIVLMAIATAVYLFMSLPASLFIWENLPLIDFVQFPWRFVGRAALPVAMLAGAAFGRRRAATKVGSKVTHVYHFMFYLSFPLLLMEVVPNLYPAMCPEDAFPTIQTVHAYEQATNFVGVDPEGSYFPRSVEKRPRSSPLEAHYQTEPFPPRVDITVVPDGATVHDLHYDNLSMSVQINTPQPFTARYFSFDFPGWSAMIDGQPAPITPSQPEGLITFPVPAGEHSVLVRWQSTPWRTALLGLSIMLLAGTMVTAVVLFSRQSSAFTSQEKERPSLVVGHWSLVALAVVVLGVKLIVIDRTDTPLRRVGAPAVTNTADLQANGLRLAGYNLSQSEVESGQSFDIDLAWTVVDFPQGRYQSNVWLVDSDGLVWSDKETQRPRLYEDLPPTLFWQPEQWGWDSREVQLFSGTPPGKYDIVLTLFDLATLQPLTLKDFNGNVVGPTAVLGQLEVLRPDKLPLFTPQYPLQNTMLAAFNLLGYNLDRQMAVPGEEFLLTLFWERRLAGNESTPAADVFELQLVNEAGIVAQTWILPLAKASYPPTMWQPGERVRGQHLVRLAAHLESGQYQLVADGVVSLGQMVIQAPDRIFTTPAFESAVNIPFTGANATQLATLIGYSISNLQSPISLIWQADAEFNTSYHVFVHLVDGSGQIVAQSDGEPANWSRPTTGWAPGEYIIDTHQLSLPDELPSGEWELRIGLYDPETNERLQAETADFVTIPWR